MKIDYYLDSSNFVRLLIFIENGPKKIKQDISNLFTDWKDKFVHPLTRQRVFEREVSASHVKQFVMKT